MNSTFCSVLPNLYSENIMVEYKYNTRTLSSKTSPRSYRCKLAIRFNRRDGVGNRSKYYQAIFLHFVLVGSSFYNIPYLQSMSHFIQLPIPLVDLFSTIIVLPTPFDDTPNSWLAASLPNNTDETPLAGTFTGGPLTY